MKVTVTPFLGPYSKSEYARTEELPEGYLHRKDLLGELCAEVLEEAWLKMPGTASEVSLKIRFEGKF